MFGLIYNFYIGKRLIYCVCIFTLEEEGGCAVQGLGVQGHRSLKASSGGGGRMKDGEIHIATTCLVR